MLVSRLELKIERMKAKTASQAAEIGRKSEAIGRLKFELSEKTAALLALEAKENQSAHNVPPFESELAALQAQAELLRDHVGGYDKENKGLRDRLSSKTAEAEAVRRQLTGSAAAPISLASGSANWSVRSAPGPPKRKLLNSVAGPRIHSRRPCERIQPKYSAMGIPRLIRCSHMAVGLSLSGPIRAQINCEIPAS